MGVNIVKLGKDVILDLTDATATPAVILTGFTAYGADGSKLQGTALGLNFTVVQSWSQPTSPAENTLWVRLMKANPWVVVEPHGLSVSRTDSLFDGIAIVGQLRQVGSTSNTAHCINLIGGSADSGVNLYVSDVQSTNNDADSHQYGWLPLDCKLYQNGAWQNISYAAEGYIYVTYPSGSYCQIESVATGLKIESRDTSGQARFSIPYEGSWIVSCHNSDNTQTASQTIEASYDDEASVTLSYSAIPEFTYTGDYDIVNDAGTPISTSQGNWNIRLLTSGKLIFQDLKNAVGGVDIFLVGGGAGGSAVGANPTNTSAYGIGPGSPGGGSGYTKTYSGISFASGTAYSATIGAGGAIHADGGKTSITIGSTTYSADGGKCSTYNTHGGAGGSGGGAGGGYPAANGGTDGGNGGAGTYSGVTLANGGTGQGTTTRAFGESSGVLYATGGGAGGIYSNSTGASQAQGTGGGNNPNTGNGGKGGGYKEAGGTATAGGSGVIIIRNHRSA